MNIRDKFRKRTFGYLGWYSGDSNIELPNTPQNRAENAQTKNRSVYDRPYKIGKRVKKRGVSRTLLRERKDPRLSTVFGKPRAAVTTNEMSKTYNSVRPLGAAKNVR